MPKEFSASEAQGLVGKNLVVRNDPRAQNLRRKYGVSAGAKAICDRGDITDEHYPGKIMVLVRFPGSQNKTITLLKPDFDLLLSLDKER